MSVIFWQNLKKRATLELLDKIMIGKNNNGKTMYADLNQVRNLIGAVANGAIVPQVVPSNSLGSPSEMKIYYAPAGSYTTNAGTIVLTANFNILIWDLHTWTYMQIPIVSFNEGRLDALEDIVGGITVHDYYKDMSVYAAVGGGDNYFANNTPVTKSGILRKVRIKATEQKWVSVKVVTISGSIAVTLHDFGSFMTTTEGGYEVVNLEDSFLVPVGAFVAIRNMQGSTFYFEGNVGTSAFSINNNTVSPQLPCAFDFSLLETDSVESLVFRVLSAELVLRKLTTLANTAKTKNEQQDVRIEELEQYRVILWDKVNTLNTNYVSVSQNINTINQSVDTIETQINAINAADIPRNQKFYDIQVWQAAKSEFIDEINSDVISLKQSSTNYGQRIGAVETKATNAISRIVSLEEGVSDTGGILERLDNLETGTGTGIEQRLGAVESKAAEAIDRITPIEDDINSTGGILERIDAIEVANSSLSMRTADTEQKFYQLSERVGTVETANSSLSMRTADTEQKFYQLSERVGMVETANSSLSMRTADTEQKFYQLSERVGTVEGQFTDTDTAVSAIQDQINNPSTGIFFQLNDIFTRLAAVEQR